MDNTVSYQQDGASVSGAPLTTALASQASPSLLQNAIDSQIVKIRPMATPIDQLSRCGAVRLCNAMKVDYYSVDVKDVSATVKGIEIIDAESDGDNIVVSVRTDNDAIFTPTETVMITQADSKAEPMLMYVLRVEPGNRPVMQWTNAKANAEGDFEMLPVSDKLIAVRMGRAATELDVQTPQFEAVPVKKQNNCQIFKMQVEQSTLQKLANKEVGWTFSDQEEVAVIDMRQGMEKNFIFGRKCQFTDPAKKETVYLTDGIWHQTGNTFEVSGTLTASKLVDLCRRAFTGNGSSVRKILVGGSGLIEQLSKIEYNKVVQAGETYAKWGIEFNQIRTNFGTLYVLHSEIFDQCGHAGDGMVIDPEYLVKYVHIPFKAETLDLRRSGQRNTDATVITEASCLVLRHPNAHMRVVATTNALTIGK